MNLWIFDAWICSASSIVKSCMRMGSGEEKEGLQEKSDPPPDQIVAVIGKEITWCWPAQHCRVLLRRGWSLAAWKDCDCLPRLDSWSCSHLRLGLCLCKGRLLVRFQTSNIYWELQWEIYLLHSRKITSYHQNDNTIITIYQSSQLYCQLNPGVPMVCLTMPIQILQSRFIFKI